MKGMENLFSRQQFICVCVFVPPGSVLQISQLCEMLKRVESTLTLPFPLSDLCGEHTPLRRVFFTLLSSLDLSSLSSSPSLSSSLLLSSPQSPGTLHTPFPCLNGEHHSRTNDASLLCSMLPSSAFAWLHFHTRGESMTAKRQLRKHYTHIDYISTVYNNNSTMSPPLSWPGTSTLHASAKAKPSLGTECIQAPQVTSSFLIKKKTRPIYFSFAVSPQWC